MFLLTLNKFSTFFLVFYNGLLGLFTPFVPCTEIPVVIIYPYQFLYCENGFKWVKGKPLMSVLEKCPILSV